MFRNKEIRRFAVLFLMIVFIVAMAGFKAGMMTGTLVIVSGLLLGHPFFFFTRGRFREK